ncbi:Alpha/Beta hydrolase protein [Massariosphaeria phaeospora]|uniref:Alpha/Beta hydrolase protein n=1 Tax=Massariosphaeria phaeospora TaxID=100035 RepID=A0A7C8M3W8_9PLEO|nr:Alpha/Beta hydrolase protein [Massariosphaeria phaeospora]
MAPPTPTPGILYVTMQPKDTLPAAQFHDWYNNEHGPGRLRLPFCTNGFRYRATDLPKDAHGGTQEQPEWMAVYDMTDMDFLTQDVYTRLRKDPVQSQRERDTMKQIHVDRRFYDFVREWKDDDYKELEQVEHEGEGNVMIAVFFTLRDGDDKEEELRRWYDEEHVALLRKVPGWRRTRRFVTSYIDLNDGKQKEFLALHEYAPENGLGGKEFVAATSTEWNDRIYNEVVKEGGKRRRLYSLYYTFGAAPRDLLSLDDPQTVPAQSNDGLTKTFPASYAPTGRLAVESFITTPDGVTLPYRLEGNPHPSAPVLVLINSILVDYTIWDDFVTEFYAKTNAKYRILRYNARGRSSLPASSASPITMNTLTTDVIALLDTLRLNTAAIAGVSLGGATALNAALMYPHRITAFVACDTNALAPPGNPKAWGERIAIAEQEAASSSSPSSAHSSEHVVGEQLAELTVRRWFVKQSYDDAVLARKIDHVKSLVRTNSLLGFKHGVNALYEYDFRSLMKAYGGKGAFLVGKGDGVLPETMARMAEGLGEGSQLEVVEGAGHLPMVERPGEVAAFLAAFLEDDGGGVEGVRK